MVSYAQNAEDVVLRRVFFDRVVGFYVDIGACDPVEDSVTRNFYEQGWHGVNVEPDPRIHASLATDRPRDVNLCAAVGRGTTLVTFYPTATRGHGTLDATRAARLSATELEMVPQITLARVLAEQTPADGIDFLKVDVEGWEAEVLASADWSNVRPRVVVVEAIDLDGRPSHEQWEGILLAARYRFGLFDGLNRFYCREEDAETLLSRLAAPANVLDNWRFARELRAPAAAAAGRQAELEHLSNLLAAEQAGHAETRDMLAAERALHAVTRDALAAEQLALAEQQRLLAAVHASTSWWITTPLRNSMRLVRLVRPGG